MKSNNLIALLSAWLVTSGLFAQTAPAPSPAPSNTAVVLPSFEVTDTADKGYLAANSVSATRTNTPIKDLPFAISAFTSQFITDVGARELYDVVKYSAGVQSGSSEFLAGTTQFSIRGFKQYPEHDGFYQGARGNVYVDTVGIERVEVVKGPSALLYGAVAPGGTVNYISKKAGPKPFASISGTYGSYDFARATLDINHPLVSDKLLFRVNAAVENGYQWVHNTDGTKAESKTTVWAPTLTWNVTPNASVRLNYQYFHRDEAPPAYPIPQMMVATPASVVSSLVTGNGGATSALAGKTGIDADQGFGSDSSNPGFLHYYPRWPHNLNYVNDDNARTTDLQSVDAEINVTLSARWRSRFNFDYSHVYQTQRLTGQGNPFIAPPNSLLFNATTRTWSVAPSWNALSAAQQTAAALAFAEQINADDNAALQLQNGVEAPAVIPKRPEYDWSKTNGKTLQWETAGNYDFAWGKVKPMVGLFYDTTGVYSYTIQNNGGAASPYLRNWDINPLSPTYYVDSTPTFSVSSLTTVATSNLAWTSDQAAYGIVNASLLHDTLFVVGGARYNRSQSQTTNYIAAPSAAVGQGYKAHFTTPQIGVGYKVTRDLMLYASYSTAYSLPSKPFLSAIQTVNGVLTSVPTTQASPTTAYSYEVGAKTDFLNGRISSTLALYDIMQDNVLQTVNSFINGQTLATSVQQTKVESKGIDYELTLSPLDNWQVFLSVSIDDARNVAEPAGFLYYLGEPPAYTSKTLGNIWTRYSFKGERLKGLWIGGGGNYQSRLQGDTANAESYFPPAWTWHSAIGYDWTWNQTKMNMTLNAENLTNKFYQPATQLRSLPRRVRLAVKVAF